MNPTTMNPITMNTTTMNTSTMNTSTMNPTTMNTTAMNPTTTTLDPKTVDTMTTYNSLLREASGGGQGGETTRGGVITRSQSGPASLRLWGGGWRLDSFEVGGF